MPKMTMREKLEQYAEDTDIVLLFADGFDAAIVGVGNQASKSECVIYDYDSCVSILKERNNMSFEEAVEYLDFNTTSAWMGDNTPIFMRRKF